MTQTGLLSPVTFWLLGSPDQGQIGTGIGLLIWAKMSRWPGEIGTATRDDVFLYTTDGGLHRYDARFYLPTVAFTYWWAYTKPLGDVLHTMFSWAAP